MGIIKVVLKLAKVLLKIVKVLYKLGFINADTVSMVMGWIDGMGGEEATDPDNIIE